MRFLSAWEMSALCLCLAIYLLFRRVTSSHKFFDKLGVSHTKPWPFFGHMIGVVFQREPLSDMFVRHYTKFRHKSFFGLYDFNTPMLVITDPDLIKRITVQDFDYFTDHRPLFPRSHAEPLLDKSVFLLSGNKWRDMRATLTPAFTGSKVRHMFDLVAECAQLTVEALAERIAHSSSSTYGALVEMKDVTNRYATDVIAATAFGIRIDSLRDPTNEFYMMGYANVVYDSGWSQVKMAMVNCFPRLCAWFGIRMISAEEEAFYGRMVHDTIRNRLASGVQRPDIIHFLMNALNAGRQQNNDDGPPDAASCKAENGSDDLRSHRTRRWQHVDVTAQCYIFFLAGLDTISSVLAFAVHELMENWVVQSRLLAELDDVERRLNGKPLTYDLLHGMRYLDMVVLETLRKWPVGIMLDRKCSADYKLVDADGTAVMLRAGDCIWIPVYAIHRDPQHYADPDKFDPDRFSAKRRHEIKPFTLLGLGAGPRNCIGSRFALMEVKVMLYYLLRQFTVHIGPQSQVPLQTVGGGCGLLARNGFNVYLRTRS